MNKPIEVKLSINADGFLKSLKEIEDGINRMKSAAESTKTINIAINVTSSLDMDVIVSRIKEDLEKSIANMGRITY